jgi:hypothetical protein
MLKTKRVPKAIKIKTICDKLIHSKVLTLLEDRVNKVLHTRRMIDTQIGFDGSTVRKGQTWAELAEIGEVVDICICSHNGDEHEVIGTAKILDRWCGCYRDIPARYVEMEQVEEDRNYTSLLSSLHRAYSKQGFEETDMITVLVYHRIS